MIDKIVYDYSQIREKIFKAVDTINDPIRQTLSPRGGNVLYTDDIGGIYVTNDGYTIARNLQVKDTIENSVLDVIRHASMRTNTAAGDATSTTVLLASTLIKEGYRLKEAGWNGMDLKHEFDEFGNKMVEQLKKLSRKVKNDSDLFYVANISSNNDKEIAENTVKTLKVTGEDGMVFIEPSHTQETEVIEDSGFHIKNGMFTHELRNNSKQFSAAYLDVPVLITDKRLYYQQEAETILSTVMKAGYKEVVIVANDFMGEALPFFVANHADQKVGISVLLVKNPKPEGSTLEDLAVYLDGKVISEKSGSIVDNLSIEDFCIARRAYSDSGKTLISRPEEENKKLNTHVAAIRKEMKKVKEGTPEHDEFKERIASLTTGMVTIRVGSSTPMETNEKIFRYEDAINATRAAMKDGYLVGGGLSLINAFRKCEFSTELGKVYKKVAEASIRQIAENCGLSGDLVIDNILAMPRNKDELVIGYDAKNMCYDDLLEAGVVDSFRAEEMAILNAVSVAGMLISTEYFILNDIENGTSEE